MQRREMFGAVAGLPLWASAGPAQSAAPAAAFNGTTVRRLAQSLAGKPYQPPDRALPGNLRDLDYVRYQMLRFRKEHALWRGAGGQFTVEFFHRGYLFKERVDLFEVVNSTAVPIVYTPDMFDLTRLGTAPTGDLGFAGFRVHFPLNRPDYFDEVCTFVGASYFRALAKGQGYGLSARGLAIKTADPDGEEFPLFRQFWLERPAAASQVMVIHALLDGPSAAAAFRFTLRPGDETIMDTQMALYPRVQIAQVGLAPMTSMFLFDASNRAGYDDYRPAVHDSDGLGLHRGGGERVWRPVGNPKKLQISAFGDASPRGFGIAQRKRGFADFQDIEAAYERRPTLWMEPLGDWGRGAVTLVEIPSDREINDNIVAFWKPADVLTKDGEYIFAYRLHWCWDLPQDAALGRVVQTRAGLTFDGRDRQFIVDFAGPPLKALAGEAVPEIDLGADRGRVAHATLQRVPNSAAFRLAFQLIPGNATAIELRARLMHGGKPLTETWLYRWTP